jgi:hypothetical protein
MKTHNLEYGVVLKECEDGTVHITFNRRNLKAVNEVVFLASVFLEPFGTRRQTRRSAVMSLSRCGCDTIETSA